MAWTMEVKSELMDSQSAKDVQGCEDMIGKHLEVLADMQVQKERWIETYDPSYNLPIF